MKFRILLFILISMTLLSSSCLNTYEKDSVGYYEAKIYELVDSLKTTPNDLPTLTLKTDKTFSLVFKNKIVLGKWNADDNGDWTYATFNFDSKNVEGRIGIDQIWILNPADFYCPILKTLKFVRVRDISN